MSDFQYSDAEVVARATALIAEFQARQEAWQKEADELARCRETAWAVAERDASNIQATARTEIRRIVLNARRQLLQLNLQLEAVIERQENANSRSPALERQFSKAIPAAGGDSDATRESLQRVRRELRAFLVDARADLEELATLARPFTKKAQAQEPIETPPGERPPDPAPGEDRRLDDQPHFLHENAADAVADFSRTLDRTPEPTAQRDDHRGVARRSGKVLFSALLFLGLAGAVLAVGSWRWLTSSRPSAAPVLQSDSSAPSTPAGATAATAAAVVPPVNAAPRASIEITASPALTPRRAELWAIVEARRSVAMKSSIDDEAPESRPLSAGETRRFMAVRSISLTAADGGAISVSLNGGKPTTLGRDGRPATRLFTTEDIGKSTPSTQGGAPPAMPPFQSQMANTRSTASDQARSEIEELNRRWFDGYQHSDNNAMTYVAMPDVTISDQRVPAARPPLELATGRRTFDQVQFDQRGDTAVLAARMIEDCEIGGANVRFVSLVSESWRRQGDGWRLTSVRIVQNGR